MKDEGPGPRAASSSFRLHPSSFLHRVACYFQISASLCDFYTLELRRVSHKIDTFSAHCTFRVAAADDFGGDEESDLVNQISVDERAGDTSATFNQNTLKRTAAEFHQKREQISLLSMDNFNTASGQVLKEIH